jgi:hypothetical protein
VRAHAYVSTYNKCYCGALSYVRSQVWWSQAAPSWTRYSRGRFGRASFQLRRPRLCFYLLFLRYLDGTDAVAWCTLCDLHRESDMRKFVCMLHTSMPGLLKRAVAMGFYGFHVALRYLSTWFAVLWYMFPYLCTDRFIFKCRGDPFGDSRPLGACCVINVVVS